MPKAGVPQDRLQGKKNPMTKTVFICNDSELAEELEDVSGEVAVLEIRMTAGSLPPELIADYDQKKQRVNELRQQIRENSLRFKFKSIGRKAFEKIVDDNPPTEKSKAEVVRQGGDPNSLTFDPDTMAPALIKASLVEPDEFDVDEAFDGGDWNQAELGALYAAAMEVNTQRKIIPMGNA